MDTKLTLRLDTDTIDRAKTYARAKNISLSLLIENYLNFVTAEPERESDISPLVKSISGSVALTDGYDEKDEYRNYLSRKYAD